MTRGAFKALVEIPKTHKINIYNNNKDTIVIRCVVELFKHGSWRDADGRGFICDDKTHLGSRDR